MGIINNQGVFIAPPTGEGEGTTLTSFREDDDFSVELFDESIVLPDLPNDIGIAFVRSSDSPADYATLSLKGIDTSTIYANNTSNNVNFAIYGDTYVGYKKGTTIPIPNGSNGDLYVNNDLRVTGFIYGNFNDLRLRGTTRFGLNTIEISETDNSVTGIGTVTANVGIITAISGITTITPATQLNINGSLVVSGVSTVGLGSTSNLTENSTLTFELTSNTNLRIQVRGTDGVIRSANIPLA